MPLFVLCLLCTYLGVAVGDGNGGLVAVGAGGGGVSGTTLRVGSGNGGVRRLLLVFEFVFSFVGSGLKSSSGSTDASTLGDGLGLALTGGAILPPEGIPCSLFPVGDAPGCTG